MPLFETYLVQELRKPILRDYVLYVLFLAETVKRDFDHSMPIGCTPHAISMLAPRTETATNAGCNREEYESTVVLREVSV